MRLSLRIPEDLPSFPLIQYLILPFHKHCAKDQHPSVKQEETSALLSKGQDPMT